VYIRIYTYIRFWPTLLVFPLRPSHTGSHGNQKDPLRDQSARNELIRPNISSHIHTRTHTQTNTHTSGAAKPVCARLHSHRNPPLARLMTRVGQNHICTVYVRYFWQRNHQIYSCIRCIYTVLANPNGDLSNSTIPFFKRSDRRLNPGVLPSQAVPPVCACLRFSRNPRTKILLQTSQSSFLRINLRTQ
jgi:hypothetical protein